MLQTVHEYARAAVARGLLTAAELEELWKTLPGTKRPTSAEGLAELLVAQKKLTPFQANEVLKDSNTPLLLNDYLVLDRLGRGGMGEVYKAQHRRMERIVAIKLMTATLTMDVAIKRFQREVKAAARLSHPNIVATHDAGEHRGHHYLVMEYVDGQDLERMVAAGPLSPQVAIPLLIQAATGLEFAHASGVIHRDIKPANLIVDKFGRLRILDMGIARLDQALADEGLTYTGQMMGTADYMAPEQGYDTKSVDGRCDVYSLGCTLYRLLTGQAMYGGDTFLAKARRHESDPIPSLRARCPAASAELESVFQRMVAKRPKDRLPSMTAVREALTAAQLNCAAVGAEPAQRTPLFAFLGSMWGKSRTKVRHHSHTRAEESVKAATEDPPVTLPTSTAATPHGFGTLTPVDRQATKETSSSKPPTGSVPRPLESTVVPSDSGEGQKSAARTGPPLIALSFVLVLLAAILVGGYGLWNREPEPAVVRAPAKQSEIPAKTEELEGRQPQPAPTPNAPAPPVIPPVDVPAVPNANGPLKPADPQQPADPSAPVADNPKPVDDSKPIQETPKPVDAPESPAKPEPLPVTPEPLPNQPLNEKVSPQIGQQANNVGNSGIATPTIPQSNSASNNIQRPLPAPGPSQTRPDPAPAIPNQAQSNQGEGLSQIPGPEVGPGQVGPSQVDPGQGAAVIRPAPVKPRPAVTPTAELVLAPEVLARLAESPQSPVETLARLNDSNLWNAARNWGRILAAREKSDAQRLDEAFRGLVKRAPEAEEVTVAMRFLEVQRKHLTDNPAAGATLMGDNYENVADDAAWSLVVRMLMNYSAAVSPAPSQAAPNQASPASQQRQQTVPPPAAPASRANQPQR